MAGRAGCLWEPGQHLKTHLMSAGGVQHFLAHWQLSSQHVLLLQLSNIADD